MVTAGCCVLLLTLAAGTPELGRRVLTELTPSARTTSVVAQLESTPTASPAQKGKLDRQTRIELMLVLVMLVAVGLCLIAFTWYAARMTRRYMKPAEKLPARRLDPVFTDDWAAKPLTADERAKLDSSDW